HPVPACVPDRSSPSSGVSAEPLKHGPRSIPSGAKEPTPATNRAASRLPPPGPQPQRLPDAVVVSLLQRSELVAPSADPIAQQAALCIPRTRVQHAPIAARPSTVTGYRLPDSAQLSA